MNKPTKFNINLDNIDKSKLFEGKKGTYLDGWIIPTPNGKYYEFMLVQETEKDEKSIIIGNAGKIFTEMKEPIKASPNAEKDDLPF